MPQYTATSNIVILCTTGVGMDGVNGGTRMATVQATVIQTGNPNASKSYTLADADMDDAIAAYQKTVNQNLSTGQPAPVVATRNQVLSYMFDQFIKNGLQQAIIRQRTVTPSPVVIS